jgi:adenine-specific DNA-methyltransferase
MIPKDFAQAHEEVVKLCDTFADNHSKYHEASYNETALRKDFLDKFFIALGWDVNHDVQLIIYR